jgi:hypothetical protein
MLDMLPVGAVPLRPAVQSWGMRGSLQTRRKGQVKPQPPPHLLGCLDVKKNLEFRYCSTFVCI